LLFEFARAHSLDTAIRVGQWVQRRTTVPGTVSEETGTAEQNLFLLMALLLPLGLALGYVMQKTNSMLASWLIHASSDIAVVLALLSNL